MAGLGGSDHLDLVRSELCWDLSSPGGGEEVRLRLTECRPVKDLANITWLISQKHPAQPSLATAQERKYFTINTSHFHIRIWVIINYLPNKNPTLASSQIWDHLGVDKTTKGRDRSIPWWCREDVCSTVREITLTFLKDKLFSDTFTWAFISNKERDKGFCYQTPQMSEG